MRLDDLPSAIPISGWRYAVALQLALVFVDDVVDRFQTRLNLGRLTAFVLLSGRNGEFDHLPDRVREIPGCRSLRFWETPSASTRRRILFHLGHVCVHRFLASQSCRYLQTHSPTVQWAG